MNAWPCDSIRSLRQAYDDRQVSVREVVEGALQAARNAEHLNAFITLDPEGARAAAEDADRALAQGRAGPLTGVPIAHKDIFCTQGLRTTCGSRMLADFVPPYESTVTRRLAAAGAVAIGKTNMDEFAMGSSNEHSHFGPARNPWDPERVPGGSSGGSAAAVAAGLVAAATGTDTGGSIRQPAALCGITGIKPTYGRVSRWGMVAYASSLDQAGVMAPSAEDCALLLSPMTGFDPRDSTCADRPVADYASALGSDVAGLRIGLPRPYWQGMDPAVADQVQQAIDVLQSLGARVSEVDLPHAALAVSAYYVIAPCEASANLSRFDGVRFGRRCDHPRNLEDLYARSRAEGFGSEVKRRILVGTFALSSGYYDAYYATAQKARRMIADDFASVFESVDVLAAPTAPGVAFGLGEKQGDPIAMYLADVNTVAVNLAGLPGLSAPAGFVDGLPVGLQLIGPHFHEQRLLDAAHALQQASDWHRQRPEVRS